jgi:hypothetical protein
MYRLIIAYPLEYKTPVRIEECEDIEDVNEIQDEVQQQFGTCVVLTESQYKQLVTDIIKSNTLLI